MNGSPSFDDIFAVMAAASVGNDSVRVRLPDAPDVDDTATRFAIALNILLDDLASRAEAKQRSLEELAATLDSIGDGVIATDAAGRIARMNPVAERLTGSELSMVKGKKLPEVFRIVNEDTREPVESPVERVLREGVVVGLANHTVLVSRNGAERAIADSAAPIRDGDGKLRGVVLVFRDQTEERDAQRAIKRGADRLQWLAESSRQFAVATSDVERLLGVVARRLSDLVGELCSIRLVSKDGDVLEPSGANGAVYHPDPETLDAARRIAVPQRVGEGISGKVVETGNALRVPVIDPKDLVAQTSPNFRALVERLSVTSLLIVPLKSRDRVLGVISMSRSHPANPYTLDDERLAQDLADRAALAIENALLFDALRKSEARFRRLVESGIIGIVVSDLSGKIHEANDAFLATVGYSREEFLAGKVSGDTVNDAGSERTDAVPLSALRAHGVARPWEKFLVHKDGRRVPVLAGAARVEESLEENIVFILDLTEQKRALEALRLSEQRFRGIEESGIIGIVVADADGNVTEANDAFLSIVGYTRADLLAGKLNGKTLNTPERELTDAAARIELEARGVAHAWEKELLRKDGARVPVLMGVVMLEGSPKGSVAFALDLTERKRAQAAVRESEALRRAKEAVEEANAELEAFSYSVAHDLRAPLRGINGFSALLLADYADTLDEGGKEYLRRIASAAERMGALIDALLGLARLTRAEPRREKVDLSRLAHRVMEQLRGTEPGRAVDFVASDGLVAHADPQLLRALLENLLGNAWKFTSKTSRARIELGCEEGSGTTAYYVRDNGAGFDMNYAGRLFAPFQRLHSSQDFEGSGIGLATVQRIVRRHGGRVWAEGAENRGAIFRFTLSAET
jgi:PAS domain S-box-containing protein